MQIIFDQEPLNENHVWIDVVLNIIDKSSGKYEKVNVPTLVDTGFSGGLRLPKIYAPTDECDKSIQFLKINGMVPPRKHAGKTNREPLKKYSLWFKILDQSKKEVDAASTHVFFYGEEYAVLGMDFIIDWKSKLDVNGIDRNFSFSFNGMS